MHSGGVAIPNRKYPGWTPVRSGPEALEVLNKVNALLCCLHGPLQRGVLSRFSYLDR